MKDEAIPWHGGNRAPCRISCAERACSETAIKSKATRAGSGRTWRAMPRCRAWYPWWKDTMASTSAALASCMPAARVLSRTAWAAALREAAVEQTDSSTSAVEHSAASNAASSGSWLSAGAEPPMTVCREREEMGWAARSDWRK
eukprot:427333-Pleurochrysis_carterae.AAC.1